MIFSVRSQKGNVKSHNLLYKQYRSQEEEFFLQNIHQKLANYHHLNFLFG